MNKQKRDKQKTNSTSVETMREQANTPSKTKQVKIFINQINNIHSCHFVAL